MDWFAPTPNIYTNFSRTEVKENFLSVTMTYLPTLT